MRWRLALACVLIGATAQAETRVIDGDSLEVNGVSVRLFGIDAPELRDPGGPEARAELRRLIGRRDPYCRVLDVDRYGRDVARCWAEGRELSLSMIQAGHAVAWCAYLRRQRRDLLPVFQRAEAEARQDRRGMWSRPFKAWRDWGCD